MVGCQGCKWVVGFSVSSKLKSLKRKFKSGIRRFLEAYQKRSIIYYLKFHVLGEQRMGILKKRIGIEDFLFKSKFEGLFSKWRSAGSNVLEINGWLQVIVIQNSSMLLLVPVVV